MPSFFALQSLQTQTAPWSLVSTGFFGFSGAGRAAILSSRLAGFCGLCGRPTVTAGLPGREVGAGALGLPAMPVGEGRDA